MMFEEYQDNFSEGESVNMKEKQNSNSLIYWKPEGQEDHQKKQKSVVFFPFIVGKGDANTKFSLCKISGCTVSLLKIHIFAQILYFFLVYFLWYLSSLLCV